MAMRLAAVVYLFLSSARASTCSDFGSDSDACLSHENRLHVSSCTFCVTDQQCHEVGSAVNPCTDACCASVADLSTCSGESVAEVDAVACSGVWEAAAFAVGTSPLGGVYPAAAGASDKDSGSNGAPWPERGRTNGAGASAHFSGGGSRAMTLGVGQTRGLRRLHLMEGVEYLVGVSGGSWFASAYTYDQRPRVNDDTRLCPYLDPSNLTDSFLGDTPDGCLLALPQCNLYACLVEELAKGAVDPFYTDDRVWVDCVGRCYLEPLGIPKDAVFTLSANDAAAIKKNNPTLADEVFLLPVQSNSTTETGGNDGNDARPYMIMGGTLVGPSALNPFAANKSYAPLEFASLGSGAALTQVVSYLSEAFTTTTTVDVKVGGLVDSFAWGLAQAPPPALPPKAEAAAAGTAPPLSVPPLSVVAVNASDGRGVGAVRSWMPSLNGSPTQRLSLSRAAGISSMAAEGLLSQLTGSTLLLVEQEVWPVDEAAATATAAAAATTTTGSAASTAAAAAAGGTSAAKEAAGVGVAEKAWMEISSNGTRKPHSDGGGGGGAYTSMLVGDGGLMENFGVFAALRRQVPRLAVHVNCEQPLSSPAVWDPFARAPTEDDIDGYVSALFGVQVFSSTGPEANEYWTFNNQVFPTESFAPLASALQQAALRGSGAVATTSLTTVANEFIGVPAGVRVLVTWNYLSTATSWVAQLPLGVQNDLAAGRQGPYKGFPHYSTSDTSLTASQVNLLANMATWVVEHNQEAYSSIFAP